MHLAQQCQVPGSTFEHNFSILKMSDNVIVNRASKLGVSLGNSSVAALSSVRDIKEVEHQRELVILNKKNSVEETNPQNLFVSKISCLCQDLTEEDLTEDEMIVLDDGHTDQICHNFLKEKAKGVAKRKTRVSKKVVVEKPIVRRSLRVQKIKNLDF
jgi:hypothetical protein